jgi:YetA-like protein
VAEPLTLHWLDGAPDTSHGSTFGAPFARGVVGSADDLSVTNPRGEAVVAQVWPTATWPDGSLKWAGIALGALEAAPESLIVHVGAVTGQVSVDASPLRATERGGEIVVDTGVLRCVVDRTGPDVIRSIERGGVVVAERGRLVSSVVDTVDEDAPTVHRTTFESTVTDAVIESSGPARAVVRISGTHSGAGRDWLPYVVRLYFYAGARSIRMMHSFVWDGNEQQDFLDSLGVRFDLPLRDALHDRHVRIAGADGGFLVEAVRGITGLRRDPGETVRAAQVAGLETPPTGEWNPAVSDRLELIPAWPDYKLSQLSSDGFGLRKRTGLGFPWIDIAGGTRADGYAYLGGPSGGFGVGVRDFWQSYPVGIDIRSATADRGELTMWLYSPEAPPMDLRFYHDGLGQDTYEKQLEGLEITYEDYEEGFGTPYGVARTHELTLFAYDATPATPELASDARHCSRPALLQASPGYLHSVGVFGDWSLVDRSTPARTALEDKLDFLFDYYRSQVEQRRWYGFWNYGDVMHTYDRDRHVWRYDVGGYAWDNSELSPDLWLWYAYLRSGRADIFRFAEAMTRHTGEVDGYHLGQWAGLGSRHNVQHWGCSAKQHRISSPAYRRIYYYLTADERTGDLLSELVDSDRNFLGLDPTRKVRTDVYAPNPKALAIGLGTDWGALAATWLTEWERTGNPVARDKLLGTMADIGALPNGFLTGEALYDIETGRFDTSRDQVSVSHLSAVFGLVEIASELISLVDDRAFEQAWLQYCRLFLADPGEQATELGAAFTGVHLTQAHSRLTAYAAARLADPVLASRAWVEFAAGGELLGNDVAFHLHTVDPPCVLQPITEAHTVSTNDAAQFALAAIQLLALVPDVQQH